MNCLVVVAPAGDSRIAGLFRSMQSHRDHVRLFESLRRVGVERFTTLTTGAMRSFLYTVPLCVAVTLCALNTALKSLNSDSHHRRRESQTVLR